MGKKKYDGPKLEDGRLLHRFGDDKVWTEIRGYIDEEGCLDLYSFGLAPFLGKPPSDGEHINRISANVLKGLREWLKEMG